MAEVYDDSLMPEQELDGTFVSPAARGEPGGRMGSFGVGKDGLIVEVATGRSHISVEDFEMAMIDVLEVPKHHGVRVTGGY